MKKRSYLVLLIGLLLIAFFMTPIREEINAYRVHNKSIFDSGFIDYGRFCFYIMIVILISYLSSFAKFNFLRNDIVKLSAARVFSRISDSIILTILVSISMLIFGTITKSVIITTYIFLPTISFFLWIIYFVFAFKSYKTIGDRIFKIETKSIDKINSPKFWSIISRELIFSLPLFSYALSVGILNFIDIDKNNNFKDRYIEYTFLFIPILFVVYLVFPATSLLNKDGIGFVEKMTKLRVNKINGI